MQNKKVANKKLYSGWYTMIYPVPPVYQTLNCTRNLRQKQFLLQVAKYLANRMPKSVASEDDDLDQWFSNCIGMQRTAKHNFLAHFMYKIKNILIYFKL
jgi:hypothetical protein